MDHDDEWLPGKLQAQLDAVKPSLSTVVIGTCKLIARTPQQDYVWPRRMPAANEQIGEYLLARRTLTRGEGYIQTSTLFVRRALMLAQPFKSGQLKHQDTEWMLRLGRLPGAEVVFVEDALAIHNIEEDRVTVSNQANWRYSLDWVQRDRHLFTPRALSGFILHQIAAEASDQGEWRACWRPCATARTSRAIMPSFSPCGCCLAAADVDCATGWRAVGRFVRWCIRYEDSSAHAAISACPGRHGERGRRAERCLATKRAYGAGGDPSPGVFEQCVGAREVTRSWTFR
jgi:hypothetical protein